MPGARTIRSDNVAEHADRVLRCLRLHGGRFRAGAGKRDPGGSTSSPRQDRPQRPWHTNRTVIHESEPARAFLDLELLEMNSGTFTGRGIKSRQMGLQRPLGPSERPSLTLKGPRDTLPTRQGVAVERKRSKDSQYAGREWRPSSWLPWAQPRTLRRRPSLARSWIAMA